MIFFIHLSPEKLWSVEHKNDPEIPEDIKRKLLSRTIIIVPKLAGQILCMDMSHIKQPNVCSFDTVSPQMAH
jgi:hypothetical protein